MTIGMLVAGIACLLAGGLAIGFGIPINEFGLGNTLILAGAITACTGLIILSLWVVVRELKNLAGRIATGAVLDARQQPATALPRPAPDDSPVGGPNVGDAPSGPPAMPSDPWLEEATQRERARQEPPPVPAAEPQPAKRRNLMFSSTSRRERERAQARSGDPAAAETRPANAAAPVVETGEPPPATFDDAWPKSERARPADVPPQRRPAPARPAAPGAEQPSVTVLKSGVVDGMAYSLYSDGSIEAQMPEGMMRFASIDELRAHLDQRP